jgi:hypothetical protein
MSPAQKIALLVLAGMFLLPVVVLAKRLPAPAVQPVVHQGVRYTIPNDHGTKAYVAAIDVSSGKQLWTKTIFRKAICPWLEHDVQWVFIQQMRLDGDRLILLDERDKGYSLDLKTRRVKKLKQQAPAQPGPGKPAAGNSGTALRFTIAYHWGGPSVDVFVAHNLPRHIHDREDEVQQLGLSQVIQALPSH